MGYEGPNLKRHLMNVHAKKGHIEAADVGKYFAMGLKPKRKRVPKRFLGQGKTTKGRWRRWCPEKDCNYLGCYLPHHIVAYQNKHHMSTNSTAYKLSLKVARRYKGLEELTQKDVQETDSDPEEDTQSLLPDTDCENDNASPKSSNMVPPTPKVEISRATPLQEERQSEETEDSEDDYPNPNQEAYFTDKQPISNRHKWLACFYEYLLTPAAGFHQERNRLQHATQVTNIINEIDPKGNDILFLGQDKGTRVWLEWVVPNLKKKAGGSLKSYLGSLQKCLEFASKKLTRPNLPVLPEQTRDALEDLAKDLKGWRQTITKETSKDSWKKYLKECDNLLTSSEVEAILTSQPAIKGRQAFTSAQAGDELTPTQYCAARDLLIILCTKAVGFRPGALENATLETHSSAK